RRTVRRGAAARGLRCRDPGQRSLRPRARPPQRRRAGRRRHLRHARAGGTMTDILVADDSPTILNLLVIALTREGFDPVTAANGEEALERIREHRPRLVILDALMPR